MEAQLCRKACPALGDCKFVESGIVEAASICFLLGKIEAAPLRSHEVRNSPTFFKRISVFLRTKAGFWLFMTALAGISATGFAAINRYFDPEALVQAETAERVRRDMETVLNLGVMLISEISHKEMSQLPCIKVLYSSMYLI